MRSVEHSKLIDWLKETTFKIHTFPQTNWSQRNQSSFQNKLLLSYRMKKTNEMNTEIHIDTFIDWSIVELLMFTHYFQLCFIVCLFNIYMSNRWFRSGVCRVQFLCSRRDMCVTHVYLCFNINASLHHDCNTLLQKEGEMHWKSTFAWSYL